MSEGGPPTKIRRRMVKIGTHNGTFHCDEVLACYLLKTLPEYKHAEVIRTRDSALLETCDIVVDVGGVFDPKTHRYDHHQRTFSDTMNSLCSKRKWTTKLSSAGLIYLHFGERVLAQILDTKKEDRFTQIVYEKVYENFVEEVDGIDNGVNQTDEKPRYTVNTNLSSRVGHLNPRWNDDADEEDVQGRFEKAMAMVGAEFMDRVTYYRDSWWPARKLVEEAIANRFDTDSGGEIIKFPRGGCPWKDHLMNIEEETDIKPIIKFVLYPDQNGAWRVQCVPKDRNTFENRVENIEEDIPKDMMTNPLPPTCPPPMRRRVGRPKKNEALRTNKSVPVSDLKSPSASTQSSTEKRPVGRPRKKPIGQVSATEPVTTSVPVSEPSSQSVPKAEPGSQSTFVSESEFMPKSGSEPLPPFVFLDTASRNEKRGKYRQYSMEEKLAIMGESELHGIRPTCRYYKLSPSTLSTWKHQKLHENCKRTKAGRLTGSGRKVSYGKETDQKILDWILEQRELQLPVTMEYLMDYARTLVNKDSENSGFQATRGWLSKFMGRHNISLSRAKRRSKSLHVGRCHPPHSPGGGFIDVSVTDMTDTPPPPDHPQSPPICDEKTSCHGQDMETFEKC